MYYSSYYYSSPAIIGIALALDIARARDRALALGVVDALALTSAVSVFQTDLTCTLLS
ncbi:hypothetical protein N9L19_01330 [bacterium]|nr:hypothetical protein [bacterium]